MRIEVTQADSDKECAVALGYRHCQRQPKWRVRRFDVSWQDWGVVCDVHLGERVWKAIDCGGVSEGECNRCGKFSDLSGGVCGNCADDMRQEWLARESDPDTCDE